MIERQLGDEYYIVESVLEHRHTTKGDLELKIRWKDFGDEEDSWRPYNELKKIDVVLDYCKEHGLAATKARSGRSYVKPTQ